MSLNAYNKAILVINAASFIGNTVVAMLWLSIGSAMWAVHLPVGFLGLALSIGAYCDLKTK
jgi:hypothetical protein